MSVWMMAYANLTRVCASSLIDPEGTNVTMGFPTRLKISVSEVIVLARLIIASRTTSHAYLIPRAFQVEFAIKNLGGARLTSRRMATTATMAEITQWRTDVGTAFA